MAKNKNNNYGGWYEIYTILKELCLTSFSWNGLPSNLNQRFMELSLFDNGQVVFFKDDVMNEFLCLKAIRVGMIDVYGEPIKINAFASNGYFKSLTNKKDGVIIFNNYVRNTPHIRLMDYAKRIYTLERTIDINIHAQKTPIILKTSKKLEFTIKNLYKQYDDFEPVIVTDDGMELSDSIKVIKTDSPYVADKLEEQKRKLWNEALSYIGIDNNSSEKNERLTKDEVMVSNGLAVANRNAKLQARQDAVKAINEMFALDISVDVNNLSILDVVGGDENEQI